MDISDINLIRTVMRAGSLSEASKQLNQSQPTLSRKLFRLEDNLRTKLFDRSPKGLTPTDIAKYIVSQAEPLEHHLNAIERHVELSTQLQVGNLRVGVGPIIEQILIPDALATLIDTTGNIQISVVTEDDNVLLDMFEASELDVVIGPFEAREWQGKGVIAKPMISDRIIAVARKGHPVFKSKTLTPELLRQYPLVAPKIQGTVTQLKGAPTLNPPKVSTDNYDLLQRLTLRLDTLCGGPRAIFKTHIERGDLREIDVDLGMFWQSHLLVRPETLSAPLVSHFVEICENIASGISKT